MSECDDSTRTRKLTTKGIEYHVSSKLKQFKSHEKKLKEIITELQTLCITSSDSSLIRAQKEALIEQNESLKRVYSEMIDYIGVDEQENLWSTLLTCEHATSVVKKEVRDRMKELEHESASTSSSKSRRSAFSYQSKGTMSSVRGKMLALEEEAAAALNVELAFEQEESKLEHEIQHSRIEQDRSRRELKLKRELAKTKAQMEVCLKAESEDRESCIEYLPPVDKGEDIRRFLDSSQAPLPSGADVLDSHEHRPTTCKSTVNQPVICSQNIVTDDRIRLNVSAQPFQPSCTPNELKVPTPIDSFPLPMHNQNHDSASVIKQLVDSFRLPQVKVEVFSGDPMRFPMWESSFTALIESKAVSFNEKLNLLSQHLAGEPKNMISNYLLLQNEEAYAQAKAELKERYGNHTVIAKAFLSKLASWPRIGSRDAVGLQRFSDFLNEVVAAKKRIPDLMILDFARENAKLVAKLPLYIESKWRSVVQGKINGGKFPTVDAFAEFLRSKSKEANNPIFENAGKGDEDASYHRTRPQEKKRPYVKSFATKVENTRNEEQRIASVCPFCETKHHIDDCQEFIKLPRKERKQFLIDQTLCFACGMSKDHRGYACQSKVKCKKCSRFHLSCLHYEKKAHSTSHCTTICGNATSTTDNSMIVPVWIRNKFNHSREILRYCVLDPQSNACFLSEESRHQLNIHGQETKLAISTMLKSEAVVPSRRVRDIEVMSYDRKVTISLPNAYTRDTIPVERTQIPRPEVASKWKHLIKVADKIIPYMPNVKVGLLIGNNIPGAVRPRDIVSGGEDQPYGQETILGWGIVGGVCKPAALTRPNITVNRITATEHTTLQQTCENQEKMNTKNRFALTTKVKEVINPHQVMRMFEADFIEHNSRKEVLSVDDQKFMKILSEHITKREDGHYEMPLPLRSIETQLPNNRPMALKRLNQLKRRFNRNTKFRDDYIIFMKDILSNCAEIVPADQRMKNEGNINYVPHTGVYHPKKQNQIRVVFDCSAEFQGVSLNDYLLQGPDLMNGLVGVLCRFRKEEVAIMADIKSMFHQFYVREQDRDMLRFLWWEDSDMDKDIVEYRMTVHLFGASSSPGCANFGLKQAATDGEEEFGSEAASFVRNNFYVDDGLKSFPTVKKAINVVKSSRALCAKAGLKLHKWMSNKREVLNAVPDEERAKGLKELDINADPLPIERALGVSWCVEIDCFQFKIELKDKPFSRRGILSTISSIYDPLGFAAPVVLEGKIILQELCKSKVDWDDPVPESLRPRWEKWRNEIYLLGDLQIERCLKPTNFGEVKAIEVHHFSDACEVGYGQCTYVRMVNQNNRSHCSFVIGKARVTPANKMVTIPRLELAAAVVSARISDLVKRELQYENAKEFFWVDSKVVLGYINNESKRFHVYVANRVQQIRDLSSPEMWAYVNTSENPSDDASRGLSAKQLTRECRWFRGPDFLWEDGTCERPEHKACTDNESMLLIQKEMRKTKVFNTLVENSTPQHIESKQLERYSTWYQARRAISNCLRFKEKWMEAINTKRSKTSKADDGIELKSLNVKQLSEGEKAIIRGIQQENFPEEIKILKDLKTKGEFVDRNKTRERNRYLKHTSVLLKLDPFLDEDDVLRVGGRVKRADVPMEMKHPVIVPKKGHVTNLLIKHYHREVGHMGRTTTHNEVRQHGYWIINGSSAVSQWISQCVQCKRTRGTLQTQKMADLPMDRMYQEPPFTYCAVDFFGPFKIKEKRSEVKRYGVLFTCMSSRGIHIESANSLETDSFLNALRRFLNVRGPTKQLRSDRGTNFVGANNVLTKALKEIDQKKVGEYLLRQQCDWVEFKFNVPAASHMGGVWERQIRTVRSVLEPLLKETGIQLNDESFRTLLSEVQNIVNSRPLTTDNLSDPNSLEPLTPNHLLTMKSKVLLPPPGNFQRPDLYSRQRWRRVQHLANQFWYRWRREYLQTLQHKQKWPRIEKNMQVGDVVIIKDDNQSRNYWQLARVDTVYPSEDGLVRKVRLLQADPNLDQRGQRKQPPSYLERPIQKLVVLVPASETKEFPV